MKYAILGDSKLRVSKIGLGTMTFGATCDEMESHRILDAYTARGGNFVDTANIYSKGNKTGAFHERGHSEQFIGSWLAQSRKRSQIILATKVFLDMGDGHPGLSRRSLRFQVEQSLTRLRTDHIDLYQAHGWDSTVPIEETLLTFEELVREGKIRYFGCSNLSEEQIGVAFQMSSEKGTGHFVSYQNSYNLIIKGRLRNAVGTYVLNPAEASRYGIGLIGYKTLASGFLAGKFQKDAPIPESSQGTEAIQRNCFNEKGWRLLECLDSIARTHSASVAQVTLAWYSRNPVISTALVGARSADQVSDLLGNPDLELSEDEFAEIDRLS